MKVYHSTPYMHGDIGGGINEFMQGVPDGAWACIRDADTMFLTPTQQHLVERVTENDPEFDLIGAMTNRIRAPWQLHGGTISDNDRISHHIRIAQDREECYDTAVIEVPSPVAGFFMLFRKSTWARVGGFQRNTAYFDIEFSRAVLRSGGRLGAIPGLYLWHTYRLGKPNPTTYTKHLAGAGL